MIDVEIFVYRPTQGKETGRRIKTTVRRLSDAADAYALALGFPNWADYSDWCESRPILHTVRVLK